MWLMNIGGVKTKETDVHGELDVTFAETTNDPGKEVGCEST